MLPSLGIDFGFALGTDEARAQARDFGLSAQLPGAAARAIGIDYTPGSTATVSIGTPADTLFGKDLGVKLGESGGIPTWAYAVGGVALLGAGWFFLRRKKSGAVSRYGSYRRSRR